MKNTVLRSTGRGFKYFFFEMQSVVVHTGTRYSSGKECQKQGEDALTRLCEPKPSKLQHTLLGLEVLILILYCMQQASCE